MPTPEKPSRQRKASAAIAAGLVLSQKDVLGRQFALSGTQLRYTIELEQRQPDEWHVLVKWTNHPADFRGRKQRSQCWATYEGALMAGLTQTRNWMAGITDGRSATIDVHTKIKTTRLDRRK